MTERTIDFPLSLPSIFSAQIVDPGDDPFAVAVYASRNGEEPGTLFWSPRPNRADCSVVLGPEMALSNALHVSYVMMVAIGDALGALMPPGIPLVFGWPDRIVVNGLMVGGIQLAWPGTSTEHAVPDWMAAGLWIAVEPEIRSGSVTAGRTTLAAEGCMDLSSREIVESFSRHFLSWMDRWLDDGFSPVRTAWLSRAANYGPNANMELGHPWANRRLMRLENTGDIVCGEGGDERKIRLIDALRKPSWLDAS